MRIHAIFLKLYNGVREKHECVEFWLNIVLCK